MPDWNSLQQTLTRNLIDGNKEQSVAVAEIALGQGVNPVLFFEECLAPSLERIGNMFDELEIFLPELLSAAEIAQAINDEVISPAVQATSMGETRASGKVLLATVKADLHDIGKNMVALMLRVNGFEVVDLGIDVDSSAIIEAAEREDADIIGLSCLLTTCLSYMRDTAETLDDLGIRDRYHLIIGGAAPTHDFAQEIGADSYGESAADAVTICKKLLRSPHNSQSEVLT